MRSLIVAKVSPIPPANGVHGALRQQNLFPSAIRSLSREIEFVWFARRDLIEALGPLAPHEAVLSSEWGLPVRLSPIPERGQRRKTLWTVYGAGALSAWEQADYHHVTGPDQVARLAENLSRRPDVSLRVAIAAGGR